MSIIAAFIVFRFSFGVVPLIISWAMRLGGDGLCLNKFYLFSLSLGEFYEFF